MRFAVAAAAAGLAGVAAADHLANNATVSAADVYVTDVVTAYTTYCPEATKLTQGGQTYTVSEATTLVITNCPGGCTITKPYTGPAAASSTPVPVVTSSTSDVVVAPSVSAIPYPASNGTAPAASGSGAVAPSGTGAGASASSTVAPYTGGASKQYFSAGAGFLALFGFVAAL